MPRKVLLMRKALTKEPELLLKPRGLGQRHPFVSPRREEKRVNMSDEVGTTTPGAPVADRDDDKAKETPSDNKQQPSSEHQPTSTARNKCAKCGRLARKGRLFWLTLSILAVLLSMSNHIISSTKYQFSRHLTFTFLLHRLHPVRLLKLLYRPRV